MNEATRYIASGRSYILSLFFQLTIDHNSLEIHSFAKRDPFTVKK